MWPQWILWLEGILKMSEVIYDASFRIRVTKSDLQRWKEAALDQRYANFSQFVRDAIEEKIESWNELQE